MPKSLHRFADGCPWPELQVHTLLIKGTGLSACSCTPAFLGMTPYAKLSGFVVCAAGSPSLLSMKLSKAHSIKAFCSLGLWKASGEEMRVLFRAQVHTQPHRSVPPASSTTGQICELKCPG